MATASLEDRIRLIGYHPVHATNAFAKIMVRDGAPPIESFDDVLAMPGLQALYRRTGERIDSTNRTIVPSDAAVTKASYEVLLKKEFRFSPPSINPPAEFNSVEHEVLYAGTLFDHYGHFLTDSMARLWCREGHLRDLPVVFLAHGRPIHFKAALDRDYVARILAALEINRERVIVVDRPMLFKRVLAPRPAMEHSFGIFRTMDRPHRKVAERLRQKTSSTGPPVYLSRGGLENSRRFASAADVEIETFLAARGFRIVRPETLALHEQIALF